MEKNVKKNMEEVTELDLMKEFMRLTDKSLREDELTVNMFMDYMDMERNRARYLLAKYEAKGILKVRKVRVNASAVNAYSPAEGTWKDAVEAIKEE